jgi:transcription termination factor Rho
MAYRATTKKLPVKKKPEAEKTEVKEVKEAVKPLEPIIAPSISIDDLIGGPKAVEAESPKIIPVEKPVEVAQTIPVVSHPSEAERPVVPSGYPPQNSGGYRPGGGRYGGYRPMRRDFGGGRYGNNPRYGENGDSAFTQDINVPTETVHGILDIMPEGHGFLRPKFTPSDRDVYISQSQIRRFLLRNGDMVEGQARPPKENERYWGLLKVEKINEHSAETMVTRPRFEDLVPVYPNLQLILETGMQPLSTRMIDLVAPIGFGQRGLVVSPPKAGKTTILKELAAGISANYPNVHLMAALIGERPEEVTDISRNVKGEVLASNFDESPSEQTRIAEVALDRAKRLVEMGKDVVILLDSITRLARAYNLVVNPSGRTLSGGFDPAALYPAKKFLGAARCVEPVVGQSVANSQSGLTSGKPEAATPEEPAKPVTDNEKEAQASRYTIGGSLTVIGTALVDTGSRMDDLIYEEFKGTGNMELHLSRQLQERRVFPAIDVEKSGTRHDELLLGDEQMKKVTTLRHMLSLLSAEERTIMMIDRLSKTKDNAEFLESLSKG